MAKVVFEQVTKRFGNVTAVNNLNLTVEDQEFLVLVGPSGCGKTTSLRMLAGLEEISNGNIYIGDRCVNRIPSKDRDIAMVFQSYALYPHMSVYDNMAFGLQLRQLPRPKIEQRVQLAAEQMGITALLNRKPRELSGGQRQRVAVGRAIVRDPSVFLMDEPLSNLDAKLRVQARTEISKLHRDLGTTFVYVTHDQIEAMTMGTRIAVMNQGILQQVDTPKQLYSHPINTFVAGFIGSPAMNFFDANVVEQDQQLCAKTDTFCLPLSDIQQQSAAPYLNQSIILGIRPEAIHDPHYIPRDISPSHITAQVKLVEMMGNETIVYCETLDQKAFVARVDARSALAIGETTSIVVNRNCLYLFESQTGQAIPPPL